MKEAILVKNFRKLFEVETKKLLKYIVLNGDLSSCEALDMQVLKYCCERAGLVELKPRL